MEGGRAGGRRTPEVSLREVFLKASEDFPQESARVVAEALEHLQSGFEAHYEAHYAGGTGASDEEILVGDNDYALAVETIARLDEPRFVAVATRMIQDGSGAIASGGAVTLELWTPHLADLLSIITEEDHEDSELRVREASGG